MTLSTKLRILANQHRPGDQLRADLHELALEADNLEQSYQRLRLAAIQWAEGPRIAGDCRQVGSESDSSRAWQTWEYGGALVVQNEKGEEP